jgi:hypothetical protein
MSNENGNGDRPSRPSTPLEAVEARIAARMQAEPLLVGATIPAPEGLEVEEESPITEDDPLSSWKKRVPGKPVTLEQVHAGLIATCEYSEAAIEGGIKMAADVHEVVQTVDLRTQQIAMLTAKVETNSSHTHKVDEELSSANKMLSEVRRDVQFLKDDMREVKETTKKIPAIIDMLGEILARLPEKQ